MSNTAETSCGLEGLFRDPARPADLCPGVGGPQRAVIAMSAVGNGAVVVTASCGLRLGMEEGGIDAGDVWTSGELEGAFLGPERGRNGGLRVWEGRIVESRGNWEHPEETEVDYVGKWRDLTSGEAVRVACGADPFRCRLCHGSGMLHTERGQSDE